MNNSSLRKLIFLAVLFFSCLSLNSIAAADGVRNPYPYQGAYPTPMRLNDDPLGDSFFKKLTDGYNLDGTLKDDPIILANNGTTVSCGDEQCYQKTLWSAPAIKFNGTSYQIYINIPVYLTIKNAYNNLKNEYPTDLSDYDIPQPIPDKINAGNPTSMSASTSQSMANPNDQVFLAINSDNNKNDENYYIPDLPNTQDSLHNGLAENVYWLNDRYLKSKYVIKPPHDLVAYGWPASPGEVDAAVTMMPLEVDGGSPHMLDPKNAAPPIALDLQAKPYNYFKHVMEGEFYTNSAVTPDFNSFLGKIPSYYYLHNLHNSQSTEKIDPVWLKSGVYIPILPFPGFQRNLIRWYTPWGAWDLLNNTSGLFVRKDGSGIELPAYTDDGGKTYQNYPLVIQSWDRDNADKFVALNLTNDIIPMVVTNYIGDEAYFPSNLFLPRQAGLIPYFNNYKVWDSASSDPDPKDAYQNILHPRDIDGFMGFAGSSFDDTTDFYPGSDKNEYDPGGQANKPYMMNASIEKIKNSDATYQTHWAVRVQHSNSFFVARQSQPDPKDPKTNPTYDMQYYEDFGDGNYHLIATFSYVWKPWRIGADGKWQETEDSNNGTFIPQFNLNDQSRIGKVSPAKATSFNVIGRSVNLIGLSCDQTQPNGQANHDICIGNANKEVGQPVIVFTLNDIALDPNTKFLVVMNKASTLPYINWDNPNVEVTADGTTKTGQGSFSATAKVFVNNAPSGDEVDYACSVKVGICKITLNNDEGMLDLQNLDQTQDTTVTITATDHNDTAINKAVTKNIQWSVAPSITWDNPSISASASGTTGSGKFSATATLQNGGSDKLGYQCSIASGGTCTISGVGTFNLSNLQQGRDTQVTVTALDESQPYINKSGNGPIVWGVPSITWDNPSITASASGTTGTGKFSATAILQNGGSDKLGYQCSIASGGTCTISGVGTFNLSNLQQGRDTQVTVTALDESQPDINKSGNGTITWAPPPPPPLQAPILAGANYVPNNGAWINISCVKLASGGSGQYAYSASVPGYGVLSVQASGNPGLCFRVQVSNKVTPGTKPITIIVRDVTTNVQLPSNAITIR